MAGSDNHARWLEQQLSRNSASSPPRSAGSSVIPRYFAPNAFDSAPPTPAPPPRTPRAQLPLPSNPAATQDWNTPRSVSRLPSRALPDVELPATYERMTADTAAGSVAHSRWFDRQLAAQKFHQGATTPASGGYGNGENSGSASLSQETKASLPAGVNALLRGQDCSANSHAEWLERQLPPAPAGRGRPPPPQYHAPAAATAPPDAYQPVAPPAKRPEPLIAPPCMPYVSYKTGSKLKEDGAIGSNTHRDWLESQLTPRRR